MSEPNISKFRKQLEAKHDELSSDAFDRDGILIEATADEMERLQQQLGRDMAIRNIDRSARLLKSIRAALLRVDEETYGVCLRCDEPIAEKRLHAIPWAPYCIECQETIDRRSELSQDERDTIGFAA